MVKKRIAVGCTAFCIALSLPSDRLSAAEPSAEKAEWLSDAASGVKLWNPAPVAAESVQWLGAPDAASGPGVAIWSVEGVEQERASGEWKAGKLDGYAVWQHSSGARYEGCWEAGLRHGSGVYIWPDGSRFCGLYQKGTRREGAVFNRDGSPVNGPLTASISQVFDAEASALRAREAATAARQHARTLEH